MEKVNRVLYESKLIGYPKPWKNKVRTFCQNPGGFVAQENYDNDLAVVNGHSYKSRKIDCCDESKNRHFSFISLSRDGNLWCGNNAGGAWRINQKTLVADPVQGLAGLGVTCIVTNRTNEVLVGTNDSGLWNINSKTLAVSQVKVSLWTLPAPM